jgi:hypothetical protein
MCPAVFLGCTTAEIDPTFVINSVDAGFYLSGFVTSHNAIQQFAGKHRFNDKAPLHVRKVCRWPAIGATDITEPILAAFANLHRHHYLISCFVATKPVCVVGSTVQQLTPQTAISVV